jgi:hypothetical protein
MTVRERMERRACDVATEAGFSRSAPAGRMFIREYDPLTHEHYEAGRFEWARGTVTVDSRTLDVQVERKP